MSIFDKFRLLKQKQNESKVERTPSEVIEDFGAALREANVPIPDMRHLKDPKSAIREAFAASIREWEPLSHFSIEAREHLEWLKIGVQRIEDFQEIDREDRDLVDEINYGQKFAPFRNKAALSAMQSRGFTESEKQLHEVKMKMFNKYFLRGRL
jgi:hypothetical protein